MAASFTFCGVNSDTDLGLIVNTIKRNVTPEITENVQDVPGMVGKIFQGNSYGQKVIEIDITIQADTAAERVEKIHNLTNLIVITGDGEYPIVFSDEPQYTYYGHFSAMPSIEKIGSSNYATTTLTFSCSDPKGYGEYLSQDIIENPFTITPQGSSECYPIFTCQPNGDVKKIAVTDEEGKYIFVGADIDPDTGGEVVNLEPMVFHDTCNTLATWTKITSSALTFNLENGVIEGEMRSTPNTLRPALDDDGHKDFGAPYEGKWHGPVRQQWLPGSYSDWHIRVRMCNLQSYARAQGKIELYLLNSNGERIGKLMLKDNGTESKVVYAQAQLGSDSNGTHKDIYYGAGTIKNGKTKTVTVKLGDGTKKVKSKGTTKTVQQWKTVKLDEDMDTSTFTDFYGYIDLEKIGNKYTVNIMKLDDDSNPAWSKAITATYTDTSETYSNQQLAGIAVYMAKYDITEDKADPPKIYTNNDLALCDVKVWNIINGGNAANEPKVIATAGDEIKINCEDRTIYKNGDIFMENFYIGSQFLTMKGGIDKTFAFEPGLDEASWSIEYTPTTL